MVRSSWKFSPYIFKESYYKTKLSKYKLDEVDVGKTFNVYVGNKYEDIFILNNMVGRFLGEFILTRRVGRKYGEKKVKGKKR